MNLSAISTRIYSVRATYEELCGRQEKPILTYTFRSCMLTDELTDDQSSLLGKSFSLVFFLLLTRGVWYEKKYIKIFKKPVEGPQEVVKRGILVHSRVLHITIYWQYVLDFFLSISPHSEVLAARPVIQYFRHHQTCCVCIQQCVQSVPVNVLFMSPNSKPLRSYSYHFLCS